MKLLMTLKILTLTLIITQATAQPNKTIKLPRDVRNDYVFIPNAQIIIEDSTINTPAFYISRYEISNEQYNLFLSDLRTKGKLLPEYLVDSIGWEASFINMYFAPFTAYYHRHQAYKDYPLVNISHQAAQAYCQWLTEIVNASANNPNWYFEFRLPSKSLWLAAAQGGDAEAVYAWGTSSLRNTRGTKMCNYLEVGDEFITRNANDLSFEVKSPNSRNAQITMPVYSFFSNPFGIFNMNGNVAEMIEQEGIALGGSWYCTGYDVRNQSSISYQHSSPLVGFRPILVVSPKE